MCVRYVASLQDSHDEFTLPSDFEAWLHFDVDIFDGKVLIEIIDRTYLPATKYPFRAGDELVSVDGKSAQDWVTALIPYSANGSANVNSRRRLAAQAIVDRFQPYYPYAPKIDDSATVVVQRQSGVTDTYTIPWDKVGTPLITIGAVPTPKIATRARTQVFNSESRRRPPRPPNSANPWGIWMGPPAASEQVDLPPYMRTLHDLQISTALEGPTLGNSFFGSPSPLFNPPPGFRLRLGASQSDQFLSGIYPISGRTIGFIRIPPCRPPIRPWRYNSFRPRQHSSNRTQTEW